MDNKKENPDYFINTALQGKTGEDLVNEGVDPREMDLRPEEDYTENEKIAPTPEAKEEVSNKYSQVLKEFNNLPIDRDMIEGHMYLKTLLAESAGLEEFGTNDINYDEVLTPKEQAHLTGYWDEDGERKWIDSSFKYMLGKYGTARVKRHKLKDGSTAPIKGGSEIYETELLKSDQKLEYDDLGFTAFNVGALRGSYMDPDKMNESPVDYILRTITKAAPYVAGAFVPGVGWALAAKDLSVGLSHFGRSAALAAGLEGEGFNKYNNFFNRMHVGTGYDAGGPLSVQNMVEQVGEITTQLIGMRSAMTGTSKLLKAASGGGKLKKSVASLSKIEEDIRKGVKFKNSMDAVKRTKQIKDLKLNKIANTADRYGSWVGRLQMSLNASSETALLAEHNNIDPVHVLGLHALTTLGFMQVNKLTEKIISPKSASQVTKHSVRNYLKKFTEKNKDIANWNWDKSVNLAKNLIYNARVAGDKAAQMYINSPQKYNILMGAINEGLEESSEELMQETIQRMYNGFMQDKKEGDGKFVLNSGREVLGNLGTSFFYGALAGGALGSNAGQKMMKTYDPEALKSLYKLAANPDMRKAVDNLVKDKNKVLWGNTKLSHVKNEQGDFKVPDTKSEDLLEKLSQSEFNHQAFNVSWQAAKTAVDAELVGHAISPTIWTKPVAEDHKNWAAAIAETQTNKIAGNLAKITELRNEMDNLEPGEGTENVELVNKKTAEIKALKQEIQDTLDPKNIDRITKEAIFKFSPVINVDENGEKLHTEDKRYVDYGVIEEMDDAYNTKIEEFKTIMTQAQQHEQTLKDLNPDEDEITKVLDEIGTDAITKNASEIATSQLQKKKNRIEKEYEAITEEVFADNEEALMMGAFDVYAYEDIGDPEVKKVLDEHPKLKELREQHKQINEYANNYTPKTTELNESNYIKSAFLQTKDGRSLEGIIEAEKEVHDSNPDEYVSRNVEAIKNELNSHKMYLVYSDIFFSMANAIRNINGRELIPDKELTETKGLYSNILEEVRALETKVDPLYETVVKNQADAIDAIISNDTKILQKRGELLNELFIDLSAGGLLEDQFGDTPWIDFMNELESAENSDSAYISVKKLEDIIYSKFKQLSEKEVEETLDFLGSSYSKNESLTRGALKISTLQSITSISTSDFTNQLNKEVDKMPNSAPTIEQELAIRDVLVNLINNTKYVGRQSPFTKALEDLTRKGLGESLHIPHMDNMFFIQGSAGSGKTSFISGIGLKLYQQYLKDQNISHLNTVVPGGPFESQQETVIKNMMQQEVPLAKDSGADVKQLIKDLTSDSIPNYLKTAHTIIYDEATLNSTEDMLELKEALKTFNERFRKKGNAPLQALLAGDPNQIGFISQNDEGAFIDYNIGSVKNIFKSHYVESTIRAKNEEIVNALQGHTQRRLSSNKAETEVENQELHTHFGPNQNGLISGVQIISDTDRNKVLEELKKSLAIAKGQHKTFAYISDKPIDAVPAEFQEHYVNLYAVQGREFDAVFVDLSDNIMAFVPNAPSKEKSALRALSMAISRANHFVAVANSTNRAWDSSPTELVKPAATLLSDKVKDEYTARRKSQIKATLEVFGVETNTDENSSTNEDGDFTYKSEIVLERNFEAAFEEWVNEVNKELFDEAKETYEEEIEKLNSRYQSRMGSGYEQDVEYRTELEKINFEYSNEIDEIKEKSKEEFTQLLESDWITLSNAIEDIVLNPIEVDPAKLVDGKTEQDVLAEQLLSDIDNDSVLKYFPDMQEIVIGKLKQENDKDISEESDDLTKSGNIEDSQGLNIVHEGDEVLVTLPGTRPENPVVTYRVLKDNTVINEASNEPLDPRDSTDKKIVDGVLVVSGKIPHDKVVHPNGRTYAVFTETETPTIMQIDIKEDGMRSGAFGSYINPKGSIGKRVLKIHSGQESGVSKVNSDIKPSSKYGTDLMANNMLPLYTWLTLSSDSSMTANQMYEKKMDILYGDNPGQYKFKLKLSPLSEFEDSVTKIKMPEHLDSMTYHKGAYIEVEWFENGETKTMVFGALPYVSDTKLQQSNEAYKVINEIISNPDNHNMDLTNIVNQQLLGTNRRVGAINKSETNHSLTNLMKVHDGTDKDNPTMNFSKRIYSFPSAPPEAPNLKGRSFILYTHIPSKDLQNIEKGFEKGLYSLQDLAELGVGVLPINSKLHDNFSDMVLNLYTLQDKGMNINNNNLIYAKNTATLVNGLIKNYKTTSNEDLKKVIVDVLNGLNISIKGEPLALIVKPDSISFRMKDKIISKLHSVDTKFDIIRLNNILSSNPKEANLINGFIASNPKFKKGIFLNPSYQSKVKSGNTEVAVVKPWATTLDVDSNILQHNTEIFDLYTTNVKRISSPDAVMTMDFLTTIVENSNQVKNNSNEDLEILNQDRAKEAAQAAQYEHFSNTVSGLLESDQVELDKVQQLKNEIQDSVLEEGQKKELLDKVQEINAELAFLPTSDTDNKRMVTLLETSGLTSEDAELVNSLLNEYFELADSDSNLERTDQLESLIDDIVGTKLDDVYKEYSEIHGCPF